MNLEKIHCGDKRPDPDTQYILEVASHLEAALGSRLDEAESLALMEVAKSFEIRFPDGFTVNEHGSLSRCVWDVDAASLAAAFCDDPNEDYKWWRFRSMDAGDDLSEISKHLIERLRESGACVLDSG